MDADADRGDELTASPAFRDQGLRGAFGLDQELIASGIGSGSDERLVQAMNAPRPIRVTFERPCDALTELRIGGGFLGHSRGLAKWWG